MAQNMSQYIYIYIYMYYNEPKTNILYIYICIIMSRKQINIYTLRGAVYILHGAKYEPIYIYIHIYVLQAKKRGKYVYKR